MDFEKARERPTATCLKPGCGRSKTSPDQKKLGLAGEFWRFHRISLVGNARDGTAKHREPASVAKTLTNLHKHRFADEGNASHGSVSSGGIQARPVEKQRAAEESPRGGRENVLLAARPGQNRDKGKEDLRNDEEKCGLGESPDERREYAGTFDKRILPAVSGGTRHRGNWHRHQRISK